MRTITHFACDHEQLVGTYDDATGTSGLLIISGGNEIRIGSNRGMADLARDLAALGYPVFRFDRRGIGDSTGENGGYRSSADDIDAAIQAFRAAHKTLARVVAFGNCDAATALILHATAVDARVLANPWVIETTDTMPPPAAIKVHYINRLKDPKAWASLLTGAINIKKLARGLMRVASAKPATPQSLTVQVQTALRSSSIPTTIILAKGDGTAIAFADAMHGEPPIPTVTIDSTSHSFSHDGDMDLLKQTLITALKG